MNTNAKLYIANAFSVAMLPTEKDKPVSVHFEQVSGARAKYTIEQSLGKIVSVIGHSETAAILSRPEWLDYPVEMNRATIKLLRGDTLLICQYQGKRLEINQTRMPQGSRFNFYLARL